MIVFEQTWDDFQSHASVIIEADENAAHAYLYTNQEFKSMVWLYNTAETPDIPDWVTRINCGNPCRNSSEFVSQPQILPDDPPYDFLILTNLHPQTEAYGNHQIEIGIIAPDEKSIQLLAILRDDQKSGWCSNASKDGPLAKSMSSVLSSGIIPHHCWKNESGTSNGYRVLEMTKWPDTNEYCES